MARAYDVGAVERKWQRHWDDEDVANANWTSGTLPDGTYDNNTTMSFCCK